MFKRFLALFVLTLPLVAQQIPLTGGIGVPGSASVLGYQAVSMTDANLTLTPAQWAHQFINVTSSVSLTATRSLILPLNPGQQFTISNNTSGSQSITAIGATGSGVTIANGSTLIVASDGTNYVQPASGTGGTVYPSAGIALSPGTGGPWSASLAPPTGAIVGTTDNQTLSNKSISGSQINSGTVPNSSLQGAGTVTINVTGGASGGGPVALGGTVAINVNAPVIAFPNGLLADYNFENITGTTLADISGSNACSGAPCNGTLGGGSSTAPTPALQGLTFNTTGGGLYDGVGGNGVQLPSALNSARTFVVAGYMNTYVPAVSVPAVPNFNVFVTSDESSGGLALMNWQINAGVGVNMPFGAGVVGNDAPTTQSVAQISGFHVVTFTLGTGSGDNDQIYIDGNESAGYFLQGASAGAQTSGHLYLGSANVNLWTSQPTTAFFGTLYRTQIYSGELTPAQVQLVYAQIITDMNFRGINTHPLDLQQGFPTLHCVGDSITAGYGITTPFCSSLSLDSNQPSYVIKNWGISSFTMLELNAMSANTVGQECLSARGPAALTIMAGTNDIVFGATPAQTMAFLSATVQTYKKAGCGPIYLGTMISRASVDTQKDSYDALILSQWKNIGANGVVDYAAFPGLGADGASANPTAACGGSDCFQGDATHPTQAGANVMAAILSNSINYYGGNTAAAPIAVTGTSYAMASGNRFVEITPATTTAITLPDCTGPSGESYHLDVTNGNAVTVTGLNSSQTVNGSTSPVTLPTTRLTDLTIVAPSKVAAGCYWSF